MFGGANTLRYNVSWKAIAEGTCNRGQENWTNVANAYQRALSLGIRPILVAVGVPSCKGVSNDSPPSSECVRINGATYSTQIPRGSADGDWQSFVKQIADRFPQALGIEVWNEPNFPEFWGGCVPDPARYDELVQLARAGVDASTHPGVPLIAAGLTPIQGAGVQDWEDYLADELALGTIGTVDTVGLHPYMTRPECGVRTPAASAKRQYDRARDIIGSAPSIWATEVGVSTASDTSDCLNVLPSVQATQLIDIYQRLRNETGTPVIAVHQLVDNNATSTDWIDGLGVMDAITSREDFAAKPAYSCLAEQRGIALPCP